MKCFNTPAVRRRRGVSPNQLLKSELIAPPFTNTTKRRGFASHELMRGSEVRSISQSCYKAKPWQQHHQQHVPKSPFSTLKFNLAAVLPVKPTPLLLIRMFLRIYLFEALLFLTMGKTKHLHHCKCNYGKIPQLFVDFLFIK